MTVLLIGVLAGFALGVATTLLLVIAVALLWPLAGKAALGVK